MQLLGTSGPVALCPPFRPLAPMLVGATSVTFPFLFMAQPSKQGLIRQVVIFFPLILTMPQETEFNLLLTSTHILI